MTNDYIRLWLDRLEVTSTVLLVRTIAPTSALQQLVRHSVRLALPGTDLARVALRDGIEIEGFARYKEVDARARLRRREPRLGPQPLPSYVVQTYSTARFTPTTDWKQFQLWALARGIHAYQRVVRGFPSPAWRPTHTMLYLGKLAPALLEHALRSNRISGTEYRVLLSRHDWMLSVTDPVCIFEAFGNLLTAGTPYSIWRPTFHTFDQRDVEVLQEAAFRLIGLRYDRGQLIDIMLNALLGYEWGSFHRVFDAGPDETVCSAGVGACFEHHRKWYERRWSAWPRLFGGQYLERYCPADFEGLPRGLLGLGKPPTYGHAFALTGAGNGAPREYLERLTNDA